MSSVPGSTKNIQVRRPARVARCAGPRGFLHEGATGWSAGVAAVTSAPLWLRALVQEIQLDAKVKLLDCPGVIFDDETRPNSSSLLLRNTSGRVGIPRRAPVPTLL